MKNICLFAPLIFLSFSIHAQSVVRGDTLDLPPEGRARYLTYMLNQELELTTNQKELVKLIYKDRSEKIDAVSANAGLTDEQKSDQIITLKESSEKEIKQYLTNGQKEKYDIHKAKIKTVRLEQKSKGNLGQDAVDDLYESDI